MVAVSAETASVFGTFSPNILFSSSRWDGKLEVQVYADRSARVHRMAQAFCGY